MTTVCLELILQADSICFYTCTYMYIWYAQKLSLHSKIVVLEITCSLKKQAALTELRLKFPVKFIVVGGS